MALKFLRVDPDAWRRMVAFLTGFSITGGKGVTVTRSGSSFQIHAKESDEQQRQYGGLGGASAYYTLQQAGGLAGSATTACTFAYHLWPLGTTDFSDTSIRLATNLQPQPIHRDEFGLYAQAATGSIGEAVQVNGTWVLLTAFGERRLMGACS